MNGIALLIASWIGVALAGEYCFDEYGFVTEHNEKWRHPQLGCKRFYCDHGVVRESQTKCIWNNQCYGDGRRWRDGCTRMQCQISKPFEGVTRFAISTELSCEQHGKCYRNGRTWRDGCHKYRCEVTTNDAGEQKANIIADYGCAWKKGCKRNQEVWGSKCVKYMCNVYVDQYNEPQSKITTNAQCVGKKRGECVKLNEKTQAGCNTFKCQVVNSTLQLVQIKAECKDKDGNCIPENRKVGDGCTTYQCQRREGSEFVSLVPIKFGCIDDRGGVCIPEHKSWYNKTECVKYTCTKIRRRRLSMELVPSEHKCPFDGRCRDNGEVWTDSSCKERICVIKPRGKKMVQKAEVVKQKCRDVYGRCKDWGESGFKAIKRGARFDKCACEKRGKTGSEVVCV